MQVYYSVDALSLGFKSLTPNLQSKECISIALDIQAIKL